MSERPAMLPALEKAVTGIAGFDICGGLSRGHAMLVFGGPGKRDGDCRRGKAVGDLSNTAGVLHALGLPQLAPQRERETS